MLLLSSKGVRIIAKEIKRVTPDFLYEMAFMVDTIGDFIKCHYDNRDDQEFALNSFRGLARMKQLDVDLSNVDGLKKSFEDFKKSHPEWVKENEQNSK